MYCFSASFCFLCLKYYPKTDLLDINKNEIRDVKIVDVLKVCGIDSNYCNDSYQVYICEKCVKTVEPFYVFKQNCSKNFLKLKGYVNQMKANANIAFHANLKVLLSDPKNGDNNNETTIEYMDMSQFLDAQIQMDSMEVQQEETTKEFDKPPEIDDAANVILEENNAMYAAVQEVKYPLINNEQLNEISKFIYDHHFMNVQESDYEDEVIEVASSPESFIDIPQSSLESFKDALDASKHQCNVCSKSFKNEAQLSVHTFLHTLVTYPDNEASNSMKYYCALCTLDFTGLALIKKHLLLHTYDKIYTCGFCKAEFIVYFDYSKHLSLYPSHKPFVCKICDFTFISERKLYTHIQRQHKLGCMFCKSHFETKLELKAHMKEKHRSTFCYICATSFKTNNSLKKHLFDNHFELQLTGPEGKPQYKCMKCTADFITKYSLNEHLSVCTVKKITS